MELENKINIIQNLIKTQNYSLAITNCKKLISKLPTNSYIHNLCGLALQAQGELARSAELFGKAIAFEPENFAAMNNLANSYKGMFKYDKSEQLYLRILEKDPTNFKALNNYGNLKQSLNRFNEAIELYLKALKIKPDESNILFSLAVSYQTVGDFKKSDEFINKVLQINPKNVSAHKFISAGTKYKEENEEHLNTMLALAADSNLKHDKKIDLFYALGKAYEDLKNFDNSFKYLKEANLLQKNKFPYHIQNDEKKFYSITKAFKEINFAEFKKTSSDKEIIFICGMPRSGTTLVEQIVASHKEVSGAGELVYLQHLIENNFFDQLSINKQKIMEEGFSDNNFLESEYMKLINFHNFTTNKITDKAPPNFRWIGFLKIFFPNCKIIHCSRNPKDNCLSIFKNSFASADMAWTHDQKDIANYYNLYSRMMKFWKEKFQNSIHEARYESLVSNPEEEIKKLIKFCNLKWDPDCLNFHKNKKTPIQTVSVVQARRPIYKSSLNSNTEYSQYLQEMYNILDTH
tara:strand:- start:222 stop:1778 length:1557 start_codon:yes stop_codon:yes gene_type:complete